MDLSNRFLICNFSKKTRLIGSSESFILQVQEKTKKKNVWKDKFYWYSIGDMIRGYINYMSKENPKLINKSGAKALVELLEKLEKRIDFAYSTIMDAFDSDPVEKTLKEKAGDLADEKN
jgi:hypothetical protein